MFNWIECTTPHSSAFVKNGIVAVSFSVIEARQRSPVDAQQWASAEFDILSENVTCMALTNMLVKNVF